MSAEFALDQRTRADSQARNFLHPEANLRSAGVLTIFASHTTQFRWPGLSSSFG
jgi:hypothetical protein